MNSHSPCMFSEGWLQGFFSHSIIVLPTRLRVTKMPLIATIVVAGMEKKNVIKPSLVLKASTLKLHITHFSQLNGKSKSHLIFTRMGSTVLIYIWKERAGTCVTNQTAQLKSFSIDMEVMELTDADFTSEVREFFKGDGIRTSKLKN